eukprot:8828244-Pyramimonas_sp.AAC.1
MVTCLLWKCINPRENSRWQILRCKQSARVARDNGARGGLACNAEMRRPRLRGAHHAQEQ